MDFLCLKEQGKYSQALDLLARWSRSCTDPRLLEINLFRVMDLMVYPELYEKGLDASSCAINCTLHRKRGFACFRFPIDEGDSFSGESSS